MFPYIVIWVRGVNLVSFTGEMHKVYKPWKRRIRVSSGNPHLKLTRFEVEILRKLQEMHEKTSDVAVNYSDFALELAREISGNEAIWSSFKQDAEIWVTPQAARPEYKMIFHSTKRSKLFKVSLNKSLGRLDEYGYVRVHAADEGRREYPGQKWLILTKRGRQEVSNI